MSALSPYQRIVLAARQGGGGHLRPEEVVEMAMDPQIAELANGDADPTRIDTARRLAAARRRGDVCAECPAPLPPRSGAGRPAIYCAACSVTRERERCRRYYARARERILAHKKQMRMER